jgi:hypothetical protein
MGSEVITLPFRVIIQTPPPRRAVLVVPIMHHSAQSADGDLALKVAGASFGSLRIMISISFLVISAYNSAS